VVWLPQWRYGLSGGASAGPLAAPSAGPSVASLPGNPGASVVPGNPGTSVVPGNPGASVVPGSNLGASVVPGDLGASVVPGASAVPGVAVVPGVAAVPRGTAGRLSGRVSVSRHALAWQVTAFMGLQSMTYYAALSWLPTLLRDRGSSAAHAGDLLALMNLGNAITCLLIPVLAHRMPAQRVLVVPTALGTAVGIAGALYAPLGGAWAWILLLGLAQGSSLGMAIFFTMARAPDPVAAASLSALAQGWGYLLATLGPLAVGLLYASTGGWNVPIGMLLVLCAGQLAVGWLAARGRVLPAA